MIKLQIQDPDGGEMIGMTKSEVKKYAAVEEMKNGCISSHIISEEEEVITDRQTMLRDRQSMSRDR